jgi:hypothetical protein
MTLVTCRAVLNRAAPRLADAPFEELRRLHREHMQLVARTIIERQTRSRRLARKGKARSVTWSLQSEVIYGPHPRDNNFEEYIDHLVLRTMREIKAIKFLLDYRVKLSNSLSPRPPLVRASEMLNRGCFYPNISGEELANSPAAMVQVYPEAKRLQEELRPILCFPPRFRAWAIETILDDAATAPDKSWSYC